LPLQQWNSHKFYLKDLAGKGVRIVPTEFIDRGSCVSLQSISETRGWKKMVIKPAISAAAFHTYKISEENITDREELFQELLVERDMLIQEFQETIVTHGEASLMVFNGQYTHAILKKAKSGDFRVQDDFGGTVHAYQPDQKEIEFAEFANAQCPVLPVYGRVDIIWDATGKCYVSEMEFLDPEIWLRNAPETAHILAEGIAKRI
jgi:glutathione synthase/RimK-type ligase-like ATP-grasp enzyme